MSKENMPVKKRTGRKRTATKKRKTTRRRKPKIKLDSGKVFLLTGAIVFFCALILAASFILSSPKKQKETDEKQTVYKELPDSEKSKEVSQLKKNSAPKKSEKKKNVESKPQVTQKAPSKTEEKKSSVSKSKEEKKPVESPKVSESAKKSEPVKKEIKTPPVKQELPPQFNIPQARNNATIAIIIDDAGRSAANVKKYTSLEIPLTIAVLPKLSQTRESAQLVRSSGKELILHQPMQSKNHSMDPGPGKITVDMSFDQIYQIVRENLAELGTGVKGLNNHEGSEVTEDVLRIGAVLDICLEKGIYFLDSRTSAQTMAPQAALERDMTIYEKAGPYIDNETTREAELKRILESLEYANKHGSAVVIGHVDKSVNILPSLLKEMYPLMIKKGYKFTTPSKMKK